MIRRKETKYSILELNNCGIVFKDKEENIIKIEKIPAILTERSIVYFEEIVEKVKQLEDIHEGNPFRYIKTKDRINNISRYKEDLKITYIYNDKKIELFFTNKDERNTKYNKLKKVKGLKFI